MKLSRKTIEYAGIVDPSNPFEIKIEILGLRNAIRQAEELISRHEQALEIAVLVGRMPMREGADEEPSEVPEDTKPTVCPPLIR